MLPSDAGRVLAGLDGAMSEAGNLILGVRGP
jgi:hypothetical protein